MTADKKKLELTIADIQGRWGLKAIGRLSRGKAASFPHIPTSFAPLDEALGIGGIPRGRVSEMVGIPTSGTATVALKLVASAQAGRGAAVYFDLDQTFDPLYASRCGINLAQLVLVRPANIKQGLAMLSDFILEGEMSLLVFDASIPLLSEKRTAQYLATTLGRTIAALGRSDCTTLFLTTLPPQRNASLKSYPAHLTLPHYAAVRLLLKKEYWLYRGSDVVGYQAQVHIVKNRHGAADKQVSIAITFNGTVQGDGT